MRPLPQVTDCGAGYRGYGQAEGPVQDLVRTAAVHRRRRVHVTWLESRGLPDYPNGAWLWKAETFESVAAASRFTGASRAEIARVCDGRQKTAKGFSFKYAEVEP